LTRAKVLLLGLFVLFLGAIGFAGFKLFGFEDISAGIAAEAVLILCVFIWTSTYIGRVLTGNMTYMEQRRKYRQEYEEKTVAELQEKFKSLSEEEQAKLIREVENENNSLNSSTDN
tara:strand:+ start:314 stop:661 length:348 start_codon:yes stop_codon:yes gene_type:complete